MLFKCLKVGGCVVRVVRAYEKKSHLQEVKIHEKCDANFVVVLLVAIGHFIIFWLMLIIAGGHDGVPISRKFR